MDVLVLWDPRRQILLTGLVVEPGDARIARELPDRPFLQVLRELTYGDAGEIRTDTGHRLGKREALRQTARLDQADELGFELCDLPLQCPGDAPQRLGGLRSVARNLDTLEVAGTLELQALDGPGDV